MHGVFTSFFSASLFSSNSFSLLGMTEKSDKYREVFFRQGILGTGKVPVIMSMGRGDIVKQFGDQIDADFIAVGDMTDSEKGIPEGTNQSQINKMPWAIQ